MKLHHIAAWVSDVDAAAEFWRRYFDASIGEKYWSARQPGFVSRFATVGAHEFKIELMSKPALATSTAENFGWTHIAISLGSEAAVDEAAKRFAADHHLVSGPRRTGDGYYEAVIQAPDNMLIELTA